MLRIRLMEARDWLDPSKITRIEAHLLPCHRSQPGRSACTLHLPTQISYQPHAISLHTTKLACPLQIDEGKIAPQRIHSQVSRKFTFNAEDIKYTSIHLVSVSIHPTPDQTVRSISGRISSVTNNHSECASYQPPSQSFPP
jgi:hypothetical protein